MSYRLLLLLFTFILLQNTLFAAQLYKWVDTDGQVHYSQFAPKEQAVTSKILPVPQYQQAEKRTKALQQSHQKQQQQKARQAKLKQKKAMQKIR